MTKFVKIQSCYRGHTEDELINIDDISRICLCPNILFLRTPYNLGEHHISITKDSVDKLLKELDIVGEVEWWHWRLKVVLLNLFLKLVIF